MCSLSRRTFLKGVGVCGGLLPFCDQVHANPADVKRVHVVFKTHLDIGYTDLAETVIRRYLENYIPHALDLAETTHRNNPKHRFRWTTGSWLIYQALEKSDAVYRSRLESAIHAGDILWHAMPFTLQSEGTTASLMAQAVSISQRLDARFGKKTIAAKMTDVPGHTRSLIPHLARQGVRFLHIGVNPASSAPAVPAFCRWRAPDGSEILLQYHKQYYGGEMPLPGGQVVTAVMMTNDNHGPQTPEATADIYKTLADKYPHAEIVASTLDEIAREVIAIRDHLPMVTQELGDTWIHGYASDPWKMACMRQLSRLRDRWLDAGTWQAGTDADLAFATPLLNIAEHTWGINSTYTGHWEIQKPEDLDQARSKLASFIKTEKSWQEKRALLDQAIVSLPEEKQTEAKTAIEQLRAIKPDPTGWKQLLDLSKPLTADGNQLLLDPSTGAVKGLQLRGRQWADETHTLGLFSYQTFGASHFDRFIKQYATSNAGWVFNDFGKPGLDKTDARDAIYRPCLKDAWTRRQAEGIRVLLNQVMLGENGKTIPGCPAELWSEWFLPNNGTQLTLDFQWFNKKATRMPEALWLSFVPRLQDAPCLAMDKLGQEVRADEVISKGSRNLHAVDRYAELRDSSGRFRVASTEAFLVSPGRLELLNFDDKLPDVTGGLHWCLCNNTWGTNFVMWYDEDMRFRFSIET
jgi:hypothetical protein